MAEFDMEPVIGSVMKGGECWLELTVGRNSKGIEIWVRTIPKVEEFIKMLAGDDEETDLLSLYTKGWFQIDKEIRVTKLVKNIDTALYSVDTLGGTLTALRGGANISFLRFVGVGTSDGVRFGIGGPVSRDHIKSMVANTLAASRQLFRDYIAPVHINLRITSTEL